ncbi:6753_t:CDS:1, partial [Gigaspora margarita]
MSSKFLTFLIILVLFLSALGSSAEPLKRQATCTTFIGGITTTVTSAPGCTTNIAIPTATVIGCGTCNPSGSSAGGSAQPLKRQAGSNCKTVTVSVSTTDTSTPGCTLTIIEPTVI